MPSGFAERYADLLVVVGSRRRHLPVRLTTAVVLAGMLMGMLGWTWAWVWALTYIATQLFEAWLLRPKAMPRWAAPSRLRMAAICSVFFANAVVMSSLSIPLWESGGRYGPAISVFLLAGAIMNLIVMSRGSPLAFLVSAAPYMSIAVSAMLFDPALPPNWRMLTLTGAVLLITSYLAAWRTSEHEVRASRAQTAGLETRRIAAETAAAAKSAFVAMVSHELRTPITAILAGAAEMERTAQRPSDRGNAALILEAARMMRGQLNDLLDLAKIEAGRMSVESAPYDLRATALATLRFWSVGARKKGVRLRIKGASRLPTWVEGDATRLRQIVNNLLSNAIKFTDQGSVVLFAEAVARPDGGYDLRFEVADSGPGLSPKQIERLFTPFDQLGAATARTHGGTGLGLAISRELARLMGGDLTASSAPGCGAVFTLTLPLAPATAPALDAQAGEDKTESASEPSAFLRVLIVDDHEINRRALSLLLGPLEPRIVAVDSGEAALQALEAAPFDLVLMDVNMPGMDGHEATRRLRAAPGPNQHVVVLAVTASASPADLEACITAGMNGSVAKPIEAGDLYAAIARVMAGAASNEGEAAAA